MILPVQLVHAEVALPVNLVAGGGPAGTLPTMPRVEAGLSHVLEGEFAYVQRLRPVVRRREGRVVPRLDEVLPHDYLADVFHLGDLVVLGFQFGEVRISRGAGVVPVPSPQKGVGRVVVVGIVAPVVQRLGGGCAVPSPPAGGGRAVRLPDELPVVRASRTSACLRSVGGVGALGEAFGGGGSRALQRGEIEAIQGDPLVEATVVLHVMDVV
mmetsp:Transcript_2369/g.5823  ORF Transcript_2369/g.5823 Transcript_2369/m.5823 type:complete len:212 (+) Transcript_2369:616-1251(+)